MNRAYEHHQEASREVVLRDIPISSSRFEIVSFADCIFMKLRSVMGILFVARSYCKTLKFQRSLAKFHFFDTGFDTECDLIRALIAGGSRLD